MMDRTCSECERVVQAYEYARNCQLIIERDAAVEAGLQVIVRKASNRRESARKAVEDHEATHVNAAAAVAGSIQPA